MVITRRIRFALLLAATRLFDATLLRAQVLTPAATAPPVATPVDLRILDRADSLLRDPSVWNRADDRICRSGARTLSLYCALYRASVDLVGSGDHRGAGLEEARRVIGEMVAPRDLEHRLMDYNNLPSTTFNDIKRVLRVSRERVRAALVTQEVIKKTSSSFPWRDEIEACKVSDPEVNSGLRFTLAPGFSLRDDGRGVYAPGAAETFGAADAGFKLQGFLPAVGWSRLDSARLQDPRNRYFVLDLSEPVPGSEPALTGVVRPDGPAGGMIRAFFAIDSGKILTPRAIPTGAVVRAARVNIFFEFHGKRYVLLAGAVPTSAGVCAGFPVLGDYDGSTTTAPLIHRLSATTWRIEMPRGGVAQLFERRAGEPPRARGAYFFSASILIEQP